MAHIDVTPEELIRSGTQRKAIAEDLRLARKREEGTPARRSPGTLGPGASVERLLRTGGSP